MSPKRKRFETVPTPWGLSAMEFQIVQRLRDGSTRAQIAEDLCISIKTVGAYSERAKQKMSAATATRMAVLFDRWERGVKPADVEVVLSFRDGRPSVQMREAEAEL